MALGLGANHMSIERCIESFVATCNKAFSPRWLGNQHGARKAVTLARGSRYRTTPLHEALRSSLGQRRLYGGHQRTPEVYSTKVAVTTCSGTGSEAIMLTNYCRHEDNLPYRVEFSYGSSPGMRVWQAAAATSAAPSYFRPFEVQLDSRDSRVAKIHKKYMDGGLYYNNPARAANLEYKLIWPEIAKCHPDIFLSLGTGQKLADTEKRLRKGSKSTTMTENRRNAMRLGEAKTGRSTHPQLMHNITSHFLKTLVSTNSPLH